MELYELIEVYDLYADEGWQGKAGVDLGKINRWREMKVRERLNDKRVRDVTERTINMGGANKGFNDNHN